MSKRFTLYLMGGYKRASGFTLNALGNSVAATTSVSDKGNDHSSDAQSQAIVSISFRHWF